MEQSRSWKVYFQVAKQRAQLDIGAWNGKVLLKLESFLDVEKLMLVPTSIAFTNFNGSFPTSMMILTLDDFKTLFEI